ncbi:hypothetical protein [Methylonatrum kenyense]|uniref:hypothetical protein n=1 Tax=Methylonatrum kenyense TaxID=455253 RepID=UPI003D0A88A8
MPAPVPGLRWRLSCVFLPFAAGYFISYLFRVMNAVIADDLATDLALSAGALGLLTSAYYLAFAARFLLILAALAWYLYGCRRHAESD